MKLFDDKPRGYLERMKNGEHPFEHIDKSSRSEAARVREFQERAFSNYPSAHQENLLARLRSDEYRSGLFELVLHELLRLQHGAPEVEPPKADTPNRVDFLVGSGAASFYLEAVLANDESAESVAHRKRFNELVDQINAKLQSPNFFVSADVEARGAAQPSAKAVVAFLNARLEGARSGRPGAR